MDDTCNNRNISGTKFLISVVNINRNAFVSRDIYRSFYAKINIPVHIGQLQVKLSFNSNIYAHNQINNIDLNIEITMKAQGASCGSNYEKFYIQSLQSRVILHYAFRKVR